MPKPTRIEINCETGVETVIELSQAEIDELAYAAELAAEEASKFSAEEMLKQLANPVCACEVDYGDRAEHCWNGDHTQPNYISRLRYHSMYIPKWAEEMKQRAPKGADLRSWRY